MTRALLSLTALAALTACVPAGQGDAAFDPTPTLAGVSPEADAELDLVDRAAALADADEAWMVELGEPLDLATAPAGFLMQVDASAVTSLEAEAGLAAPPSATYQNIVAGVALAALAEVGAFAVIAPPAAAVKVVSDGAVTPLADNVWMATQVVTDGEQWLAGRWTVAWVGAGWLAEMRVSSGDGAMQDQLWFAGFLSADGGLGWWDFFDRSGQLVGVVEWVNDGQGGAELGIISLAGGSAGDTLSFWHSAEGEDLIAYTDASAEEAAWVYADAHRAGEVRAPDYNGGAPGCWAPGDGEAPYVDLACPE